MSGRILQAIMVVLTCYVAGQKHGSVSAEADRSNLANRLQDLEAQLQKQNEINNQQAEALAEQAAFMAGQADQLQKQADQLQKQAASITAQSDRMAGLELENQKQTKFNAEQTEITRDLGLENQKQARVITEQGEKISDLDLQQSQQDNIVAFTAFASQTRTYNAGDRVLFDSVLRNYGDSYESMTSIFTCSVSGFYLFSVTVMTHGDDDMHAQIQLDDTSLVTAYSSDWEAGSNMVVTYCAEGQTVWIMCVERQGDVMYDNSYRYSTFSGTLLTLA